MRASIIWSLVKDDWYRHRWMISSCLFIPLILEVLLIWQNTLITGWFQDGGMEGQTVAYTASVLLTAIPYMLIWITSVTRLTSEAYTGFYVFARTLPITAEEVVTAKFISSFVLNFGGALWFALLWGIYEQGIIQSTDDKVWTALYLVTFSFPLFLAFHHGLFFRSGTKGATPVVYLLLVAVMFMGRGNVVEQWVQSFLAVLFAHPVTTIGIGTILLLVVWLLCWRWAMKTYRQYLEGTLKSHKKRKARRTTG
ncbi:ABC-2 transporter permease [Lentibacillus sp. N15]|uniref:ABC-2 transporter permease n=1 Tax=Lentibacillus songyuanensis TaxID=3136161 RepID=UPI0031BB77C3